MRRSLATTAGNSRLFVNELSFTVPNGYSNYLKQNTINATQWLDGNVATGEELTRSVPLPTNANLSADALCARHGWGDNAAFPSHASPLAVSAKSFGAIGDGVHDDTVALQSAVDSAARLSHVVFWPWGAHRTSRTVVVPSGVRLSGLARHLTGTVAFDGGGRASPFSTKQRRNNEPDYDDTPPIIAFSDMGAAMARVARKALPRRCPRRCCLASICWCRWTTRSAIPQCCRGRLVSPPPEDSRRAAVLGCLGPRLRTVVVDGVQRPVLRGVAHDHRVRQDRGRARDGQGLRVFPGGRRHERQGQEREPVRAPSAGSWSSTAPGTRWRSTS